MRGLPLLVGALAVTAVSCGGDGQASDLPTSSVTLGGVGEVPPTLSPASVPTIDAGSLLTSPVPGGFSPSTGADGSVPPAAMNVPLARVGTIGEVADGNRVLVIGDSLMAATAVRYGGAMCERLVPLGWSVAVEAETGQQVAFGDDVLDERLWEGWDVAVIMLGNNYNTDQVTFESELDDLIGRLAPRPTLVFTVTEFEPSRVEVNESIRRVAALHQNVRVADWANLTGNDTALLSDDGLHLSETGRTRLVEAVVADLGLSPAGHLGECLPSSFNDDG